jgi:hypothetical protein
MLFHEMVTQVSRDNFRDIVNGATEKQQIEANKMADEIMADTEDRERLRRNAVSLMSQAIKPWEVDDFDKKGALIGTYIAIQLSLDGEFDLKDMFMDAGLKGE